jgi:hypothetical protein
MKQAYYGVDRFVPKRIWIRLRSKRSTASGLLWTLPVVPVGHFGQEIVTPRGPVADA